MLLLVVFGHVNMDPQNKRAFYIGTQRSRLAVDKPTHRPTCDGERWEWAEFRASSMQGVVVLY